MWLLLTKAPTIYHYTSLWIPDLVICLQRLCYQCVIEKDSKKGSRIENGPSAVICLLGTIWYT